MSKRRADGPTKYGAMVPARTRRWLYGIAAAAAPLATVYGLVTDQQSILWLNLAGAVLFTMAVGNTPTRPEETTEDEPA